MVVPLEIWDTRDSWAETAEELAAECAHVTVEDVETWLRRGGDPNDVISVREGHPHPPWPFLNEVAGRGRIDLMELLLSYGCPVPLTVRGTQTLVSFAPLAFKLFYAARQNAVLRRSPFPPP